MKKRGKFITLEGCDGVGKTTIARKLANEWPSLNLCFTKEPYKDTCVKFFTSNIQLPAESEFLIFEADRIVHWDNYILPLLREGHNIICDRFIESSLAYQGGEHGEAMQHYYTVHSILRPAAIPDLTLLLDVPTHVCKDRIAARQDHQGLPSLDRWDNADYSAREQVRNNYLKWFNRNEQYDRIKLIDACGTIEGTTHMCAVAIKRLLESDNDASRI